MVSPTRAAAQTIRYVDDDTCPNQGSGTQGDPFCSIQDGIDLAVNGDTVLVLAGTYGEDIDFDDKKIELRSESGPTATTIQRVSGNGPTVTIISGQGSETVLDGFTITGGNRGGIFIRNTSPVIANCIFTNNTNTPFFGDGFGGGIRIEGTLGFDVLISDCVISDNTAKEGGGIHANESGSVRILRCVIEGNKALDDGSNSAYRGGGIFADNNGSFTMFNTIVRNNHADQHGGGMSLAAAGARGLGGPCDPNQYSIVNCLFHDNTAGDDGGAIRMGNDATFFIGNSTFSQNSAERNGGAIDIISTPCVEFRNAIFWDDSAPTGPEMHKLGNLGGADITIDYCDVKGGLSSLSGPFASGFGTHNIDADPLFVYPFGGDFRLRSGSPANDAGNDFDVPPDVFDLDDDTDDTERTPLDLADEPRFTDDPNRADTGVADPPTYPLVVDMGAYELAIPDCPDDQVPLVTVPPDGTIDARQPHPVNDNSFTLRQGIGGPNASGGGPEPIVATVSFDCVDDPAFWGLEETGIEDVEAGTDPLDPNFIFSVTRIGMDQYEILLDRPISGGHWTEITFLPTDESVCLASLPADANGDGLSASGDITEWINFFNGIGTPPHGFYSMDINHSGVTNTQDLIRLIDLLNGAGTYIVWIATQLPTTGNCDVQSAMGGGGGGTASLTSLADPGQANAELSDAFVTFLTTQTPADLQAENDFGAAVQSITAFCTNLFSDAELAALADRLHDPTLAFASEAGGDAAAAVVETIRS